MISKQFWSNGDILIDYIWLVYNWKFSTFISHSHQLYLKKKKKKLVTNSKQQMVTDIKSPKFIQKIADITGNVSLVSLIAQQKITWLIFLDVINGRPQRQLLKKLNVWNLNASNISKTLIIGHKAT